MRTIGKRNVNLVKRLTRKALEKRKMPWGIVESYQGIDKEIIDELPVKLWDTWEMADQEIRRIINDTIGAY